MGHGGNRFLLLAGGYRARGRRYLRQPQQFPARTFHRLHRGVGIDFVVTAVVEESEGVGNQSKSRHKRTRRSHPRNLAAPYDSKGAVSRGMRMHRASRLVSV